MKTIPKLLLLAFAAYFLTGCMPILMWVNGMKSPAIENEQSIKKCALRYKIDTASIVTVNGHDYIEFAKDKSVPDAEIYDAKGNLIEYKTKGNLCTGGLFQLIPSLSKESSRDSFGFSFPGNTKKYNTAEKTNLADLLSKCRTLRGNPLPTEMDSQYDFYMVIYLTTFIGKLNKHEKVWTDLAKRNHKCRIKVININLDGQEYWDAKDKDSVMQMMTGKN